MKKILLVLLVVFLLVGTAYALILNLFPNTAMLPRIPIGDGTIGKAITKILGDTDLGNYVGDGTVGNTLALSGVTASGYLKNNLNCPGSEKYIGVDNDGRRICGTTVTLLADFGKIQNQDCPANYYRADGSQGTTATGNILKSGDIVKTPPGCSMTIVFEDFSLLRLDGDTTISLDLGSLPDGTTIASAILSNGSIWGRILTETGSYNIGTDTVVAGVRGTSISVVSTGNTVNITNASTYSGWEIYKTLTPYSTLVNLIDSRFTNGATVRCRNTDTQIFEDLDELRVGGTYTIDPNGCHDIQPTSISVLKNLNFSNPWIRKNTREDIAYMYRLRSLSGAVLPVSKMNLLENEIITSRPNVTEGGTLSTSGSLEATSICESGQRWWNEREGCQESSILAIVDFTRPVPDSPGLAPLAFYGNPPSYISTRKPGSVGVPLPGNGVSIPSNGYIYYSGAELLSKLGVTHLNGKVIIIETSTGVTGPKTLIDFGGTIATTGGCTPILTCTIEDISNFNQRKWKITINSISLSTTGSVYFGGKKTGIFGINAPIKNISIQ